MPIELTPLLRYCLETTRRSARASSGAVRVVGGRAGRRADRSRCQRCCSSASATPVADKWRASRATSRTVGSRFARRGLPDEQIDSAVVQAMAEVGLDVSAEFPKPLTDAGVRAADVVVTLGCRNGSAVYPGKRYRDWPVADPAGQPLEIVRRIRYDMDHDVWELIETLVPAVELVQLQRPSSGPN